MSGHDVRRLELSRDADRDLERLLIWGTSQFGEVAADRYYFSFQTTFDLLILHPHAGARYEEIDGDLRVVRHKSHRVFYLVQVERVLIVRVLHQAMDAPRWLE